MEQAVLGRGHKIKKFDLLDFSAMRRHLDTVKQIKRAATDGEKAVAKTEKEELKVSFITPSIPTFSRFWTFLCSSGVEGLVFMLWFLCVWGGCIPVCNINEKGVLGGVFFVRGYLVRMVRMTYHAVVFACFLRSAQVLLLYRGRPPGDGG